MTDFNPDEFLDWLDDQDGCIPESTMGEQWPNFPWSGIGYTIALKDGESCYYQRDLRKMAKRQPMLDW